MEWRDMRDAPKDGTPFLAELRYKADLDWGGLHVIRWDEGWQTWVLDAVMVRFDNTGDENDDAEPVAWMPLPAPPARQG